MNFYVLSLLFAIPSFAILILIEQIISKVKKVEVNNHEDMISSLSSGMTNIISDVFKLSFVLVSYGWLVDNLAIESLSIENQWLSILIAFIVLDFTGYWMHRLSHRVNIFWNRHVIHHSSEEFNLSCALRQSVSHAFKFSAILMIPAAVMGIDKEIFIILAPIHLFMQFWYHTRLIDKMGFLEYVIVTPSHHRVHHAINPEYIDKNYGQILIIWDKIFNTFQVELENIKPVYGVLRPVSTWNPLVINFKHIFQLFKDAWNTKFIIDKVKIWFMPTGWRPSDLDKKSPLKYISDPLKLVKYKTNNSNVKLFWIWTQYFLGVIMMFHLFLIMDVDKILLIDYMYALFIMMHIFSYTSALDKSNLSIYSEMLKIILGLVMLILFKPNIYFIFMISAYFTISLIIAFNFLPISNKNKLVV
tara:strand:- start:1586 stop:2833 length:1248 start_codon:yes stop_codon:yes gene_type:complete